MTFSNWISLAAIAFSAVALVVSIASDRRAAQKHGFDIESTWHAEVEVEHEAKRVAIRFICKGPQQIRRAWVKTGPLLMGVRTLPISYLTEGYEVTDGDFIHLDLPLQSDIADLIPDTIEIEWLYAMRKWPRAWARLRRLSAPEGYAEPLHFHNVVMRDVKRAVANELKQSS
ncbi:hypothetical protein [Leucobacter ruminantium]|uniref:Uncharacterized protein n=1 Tax=Leucobacter ruminantium TaxID=1289170 RepID=A0A939LZC9_9MICO|nr:hypothetical protein [Leucobacter ruminantium]MBO1805878.1 hypothetical protein [Leucobacter ruminantium]